MADNYTRQGTTFRAVDNSSVYLPGVVVAPHMPTVVSGAQYAQTVGSGVFTMTVPSGATHALISVRNDAVHYVEDGSTPSSTNGIYLPNGFIGELPIPQALKFTRVATDAIIAISYRKYV